MSAARSLLLQADRRTHTPTQTHLTCSPPIARKPHIQSEQQPTHHDSHTGSRTGKTSSPNSHASKGYFSFFFSFPFSFFSFFFSFPFCSCFFGEGEGEGRLKSAGCNRYRKQSTLSFSTLDARTTCARALIPGEGSMVCRVLL